MSVRYCRRCATRYVFASNSGDLVHDCSQASSEALRNEDVFKAGPFIDFTGSFAVMKGDTVHQGVANTLWGTTAWLMGAEFEPVTSRGNRKSTHRTRKFLKYIENPDAVDRESRASR